MATMLRSVILAENVLLKNGTKVSAVFFRDYWLYKVVLLVKYYLMEVCGLEHLVYLFLAISVSPASAIIYKLTYDSYVRTKMFL
jgi:hypothetical protein